MGKSKKGKQQKKAPLNAGGHNIKNTKTIDTVKKEEKVVAQPTPERPKAVKKQVATTVVEGNTAKVESGKPTGLVVDIKDRVYKIRTKDAAGNKIYCVLYNPENPPALGDIIEFEFYTYKENRLAVKNHKVIGNVPAITELFKTASAGELRCDYGTNIVEAIIAKGKSLSDYLKEEGITLLGYSNGMIIYKKG